MFLGIIFYVSKVIFDRELRTFDHIIIPRKIQEGLEIFRVSMNYFNLHVKKLNAYFDLTKTCEDQSLPF
jgi:hypothetical protein